MSVWQRTGLLTLIWTNRDPKSHPLQIGSTWRALEQTKEGIAGHRNAGPFTGVTCQGKRGEGGSIE